LCFVVSIATGALWRAIEITPDFLDLPRSYAGFFGSHEEYDRVDAEAM